jgi:transposase
MKSNRIATEVGIENPQKVQLIELDWDLEGNLTNGKTVRLRDFPANRLVKVFSIAVMTDRIDYIVTNDLSINTATAAYEVSRIRWNIECFNRELKQVTGIKKSHCRKLRSKRNHIHLAMTVWLFLKWKARSLKSTIYKLNQCQLNDYYKSTMASPLLKFEM